MLHEARGQHQCADGHIFKAPGHSHVQHHVRGVAADEQLGGHGGVYLTHTPGAGHHILPDLVKGRAGYLFQQVGVFIFQQAFDLAVHGIHHAYFHGEKLLSVANLYTLYLFCPGLQQVVARSGEIG